MKMVETIPKHKIQVVIKIEDIKYSNHRVELKCFFIEDGLKNQIFNLSTTMFNINIQELLILDDDDKLLILTLNISIFI